MLSYEDVKIKKPKVNKLKNKSHLLALQQAKKAYNKPKMEKKKIATIAAKIVAQAMGPKKLYSSFKG